MSMLRIIRSLFSKTSPGTLPLDFNNFLVSNLEEGNEVFVSRLSSGKRIGLAMAPMTEPDGTSGSKKGRFAILLEGDSLTISGTRSQLTGYLTFDAAPEHTPYHNAYGMRFWISHDDMILRTMLFYRMEEDARIIWRKIRSSDEDFSPPLAVPHLPAPPGNWSRSFSREGTVVIDPSEGSGYSREGDEYQIWNLVLWEDGIITVFGEDGDIGQLDATNHITWRNPSVEPAPTTGPRHDFEALRFHNGTVHRDGDSLILPGGYAFTRS